MQELLVITVVRAGDAGRYTASLLRKDQLHFMRVSDSKIEFSDADLKEVFALFSSSTAYELNQVDDPANEHYFERVNLMEEYELSYARQDFAVDALRAVLAFLHRHGYRIEKGGEVLSLGGISEYFIE